MNRKPEKDKIIVNRELSIVNCQLLTQKADDYDSGIPQNIDQAGRMMYIGVTH
jgi:hypothetical protein